MRFQVIALHFTKQCNLNCPFCYRGTPDPTKEKPRRFFLDLVKPIKQFAPQIALGGGEPLLDSEFIKNLGSECKKQEVILNFTTNGKAFAQMIDSFIQALLQDITMISISFDYFKWGSNPKGYAKTVQRIKQLTDIHVGANLLIDPMMFRSNGLEFGKIVTWLFEVARVDRVFALYPKKIEHIDILPFKPVYQALTLKYPMFFVDDLTNQILEQGYSNWTSPCHYGKDLISINEQGYVSGCSFDEHKVLKLNQPQDLLKIQEVQFEERYECPFLVKRKVG